MIGGLMRFWSVKPFGTTAIDVTRPHVEDLARSHPRRGHQRDDRFRLGREEFCRGLYDLKVDRLSDFVFWC